MEAWAAKPRKLSSVWSLRVAARRPFFMRLMKHSMRDRGLTRQRRSAPAGVTVTEAGRELPYVQWSLLAGQPVEQLPDRID